VGGSWIPTGNICPIQPECTEGALEVSSRCWDNQPHIWRYCQNGFWVAGFHECVCPVNYFCLGDHDQTVTRQESNCELTTIETCNVVTNICVPGYSTCQLSYDSNDDPINYQQSSAQLPYSEPTIPLTEQQAMTTDAITKMIAIVFVGVAGVAIFMVNKKW
jgi:hypothetical protein